MTIAYIITTIQSPTPGIVRIADHTQNSLDELIVIGDRRTPEDWACYKSTFISLNDSSTRDFMISRELPIDSYTRKMLGYLHAARKEHSHIRETDDDNIPNEAFFGVATTPLSARLPAGEAEWINPYAFFTDRFIWPRGFPLELVRNSFSETSTRQVDTSGSSLGVIQALANGDPDVDAIYRLTGPRLENVEFEQNAPLLIPETAFTPFNSQVTTWPIQLLPLMYLPMTCSFRMTDIWRSFIAQHLMRRVGACLFFTSPAVRQDRNPHNLLRDFSEEIEGYLGYQRFVDVLKTSPLTNDEVSLQEDLRVVYEHLIVHGFFAEDELRLLNAWIEDVNSLGLAR